ncbi:MdfA family multidrug efflux MFS transporter [Pseudomonas lini]|uniref:MFS transporter n=1 Tax=Pseudomonas lini TaxID=163011 RepID=A0A0J6GUX9_9PSED|nr:MdfA family multidrug efflux MFS transporter [Pseudomonas lini]KAB0507054.1 MFS transporter [Pseudomonas lini]KMM88451.1 MFS transporter [Pseudomonas lini]SDT42439.1 MFS transporter, DHA1 family, multidrug/chloramphenicol efflux transport protein [Pseudomonas lini]
MLKPLINISPHHLFGFCLAITLFELLTYMGSDMIMPAMLTVTRQLDASPSHVPFAFNLYLIGGILLQWLIGPLSDHFGRRRLLLIGCAGFALACAAAFYVQSILAFNSLRLIQGMGLGFVIAVSYPALQEVFCEADAVKIMALLGNVALLSPLLGPLLGSLALEWLSWRELFLLLGIGGAMVWLGLYWFMPETVGTLRQDGQQLAAVPFEWGGTVRRYAALLGNPPFLSATIALGLMSLPLIAWIGLAPLLLVRSQGLSTLHYGLWQIPVFAAVILGNLILNRLIASTELTQLIRYALWPFCGGLVALIAITFIGASTVLLVSCLSVYAIGLGMSNAALYRLALFSSDDSKGLVSAMVGMISIAVMGVGGSIIAALGAGDSLEAFALMAGLAGLLCLLPLRLFLRRSPIAHAA